MKKSILAVIILFSILVPASSSPSKGVYVLCYHALKTKKDMFSLSPDQFREQLQRLKKSGFSFVSFEDVKEGRLTGSKNILITIDDGNESVYSAYFGIMKPMGIKPVLGIYPAVISKMKYAMTWEQIKRLKDEGCYIAAHGYNHMYLSSKYYKQNMVQFKKEIYLSKKVLEKKLGITIDTMIYPFGVSSPEAITDMKDAGYKYGFCLVQKKADVPVYDPFQIPRYMLTKPNQKGIIGFIIQNSAQESNIATAAPDPGSDKSDKKEETNTLSQDRVTIKNYPGKLKKLVINDSIFTPDEKVSPRKKKGSRTSLKTDSKSRKNIEQKNKKIKYFPSKEHKKMTGREAGTEKHSFLHDIKNFYFTLLQRSTSFILSFRDMAWSKLASFKQKTASLFS